MNEQTSKSAIIISIQNFPDLINEVIELGDKHSNTLGFFPREAFIDQANKGYILCAVIERRVVGYLMYRLSFDRINIVHLCVDEVFRGKKIALELLDKLKVNFAHLKGIRLKCRNDYDANSFWQKANFHPILEVPGRSRDGHLLTVWWYENPQSTLFSFNNTLVSKPKRLVALDTNIFIDLKEEREVESLSLLSDWINDEIELCLTKEIYTEILRNKSKSVRDDCRNFIQHFTVLEFNEQEFNSILLVIQAKFKQRSKRDISDLRQIINAIVGGAEYFLTRDEYWLSQSKYFEDNYNINILRPATFITELDEIIETTKYEPKKLAGTEITSEHPTSEKIESLVSLFSQNKPDHQEKKASFKRKLRGYLSNPVENEIYSINNGSNEVLAFIAVNHGDKDILKISFLRAIDHSLKRTIIRQLLYKLVGIALSKGFKIILIEDEFLCPDTKDVLNDSSFFQVDNVWVKINLVGIHSLQEIKDSLQSLLCENEYIHSTISKISSIVDSELKDYNHTSCYQLEKILYPVKIAELDVPCFIIPIKHEWASFLFEERLQEERLGIFKDEKQVILNRTNVYYRSSKPRRLQEQSRILWYISSGKKFKGFISATSYIDKIEINKPKVLFKKYKNIGIYEWSDISTLVKGNLEKEIMVFVFSNSVLLKNIMSITKIKGLFRDVEKKEFNPISPIKISKELYLKIFENCSKHEG